MKPISEREEFFFYVSPQTEKVKKTYWGEKKKKKRGRGCQRKLYFGVFLIINCSFKYHLKDDQMTKICVAAFWTIIIYFLDFPKPSFAFSLYLSSKSNQVRNLTKLVLKNSSMFNFV